MGPASPIACLPKALGAAAAPLLMLALVACASPDPSPASKMRPPPTSASQASVDTAQVVHAPSRIAVHRPRHPRAMDARQAGAAAMDFVELGTMDSTSGQPMEQFLVRVAQVMDLFTRTTGHEVCGVVMHNQAAGKWRVRLTTDRSHIGCTMVEFPDPGYVRVDPDIHSHPRLVGGTHANAQDVERKKELECGQSMVVFDETFSRHDLDRGPGYLVSRGRLLFQHGRQYPFQQRAVFASLEQPPADFQPPEPSLHGKALPGPPPPMPPGATRMFPPPWHAGFPIPAARNRPPRRGHPAASRACLLRPPEKPCSIPAMNPVFHSRLGLLRLQLLAAAQAPA